MSNNKLNYTEESPTVLLVRERIKAYQETEGCYLTEVAEWAGVSHRYLVEICGRPPGKGIKTQRLETLIDLVDRLAAIGVDISREDICKIIMDYPLSWQSIAA